VEAAVNNDEQADLPVWAAPEETHTLPVTETMSVATHVQTFEFEMLEPNKEDVAMFSGVIKVNGMESNMIELPVLKWYMYTGTTSYTTTCVPRVHFMYKNKMYCFLNLLSCFYIIKI